uniref:WAP domain-containing protein n=1 Tax=Steinernema glaseri TaxID=37863 RepID=A0A1I7YZU4_9BILA
METDRSTEGHFFASSRRPLAVSFAEPTGMLLKSFVLAICIAQIVHTGYGHSLEGRKLSVRTKRQHCSCVIINVAQQQLQCSCDSNEKNGQSALLPQQQRIDQQELQQELSHLQPAPNAQCGCVLIVIQNNAQGFQSPQYQCQCSTSNKQTNTGNVLPGQSHGGNGQPGQTHGQTQMPTLMTTTHQPAASSHFPILPSTAAPHNGANGVAGGNRQQNPCQCVMISLRGGPQSQYQCDCDQRGSYETQPSGKTKEIAHGNNDKYGNGYQTAYVGGDDKQVSFETAGNGYPDSHYNVQNGHGGFPNAEEQAYHGAGDTFEETSQTKHTDGELPATTPCIIIRLPQNSKACVCQDNYVQCGENTCCLSSRYRSMKGNAKPEAGENSAVDLIMDVLKSIKTNLQKP